MPDKKEEEEKARAFKICGDGGGSLNKDQLYNFLCALGLTPTGEQTAGLPGSSDLAAASAKYDEMRAVNHDFEEADIRSWFTTWDPKEGGSIDIRKLKGETDAHSKVVPFSDAELEQLKKDLGEDCAGDTWTYEKYLAFMASHQSMQKTTSTI